MVHDRVVGYIRGLATYCRKHRHSRNVYLDHSYMQSVLQCALIWAEYCLEAAHVNPDYIPSEDFFDGSYDLQESAVVDDSQFAQHMSWLFHYTRKEVQLMLVTGASAHLERVLGVMAAQCYFGKKLVLLEKANHQSRFPVESYEIIKEGMWDQNDALLRKLFYWY
eukprot:Trichotokara_eunicae@DN10421_c0_g1_i1.p1